MNLEMAGAQINSMCRSCVHQGMDCKGVTDSVWTGCVYRKPDHRMEITVTRVQGSNYTPADLMQDWAKANEAQFYRTEYGSARIRYKGKTWEYGHWKIVKNEDNTECIFLHLQESFVIDDLEGKKNG